MSKETIANGMSITEAILEMAEDANLDKVTMKEIKDLLIPKPKKISSRQICKIRKNARISQGVMAEILNVSVATYRKWESGEISPKGPALRCLHLIKDKGLSAIF